jgi:hypothetical protein
MLLGGFARKCESRSNVFGRDAVFPLNFFEGHAARDAARYDRNWHARAANHGFAMRDSGIDGDAILERHDCLDHKDSAVFVELADGRKRSGVPRLRRSPFGT